MTSSRSEKKALFRWSPNGRTDTLHAVVERLIANPHYDLAITMDACIPQFSRNSHLMDPDERKGFVADVLPVLRASVEEAIHHLRQELVEEISTLSSSILQELETADRNPSYLPDIDRSDRHRLSAVDNLHYDIRQLTTLVEQIEEDVASS